jgi:hypothetical protein
MAAATAAAAAAAAAQAQVSALQDMLAAKQRQLQDVLATTPAAVGTASGGSGDSSAGASTAGSPDISSRPPPLRSREGSLGSGEDTSAALEGYWQMEEFRRRGISLAQFDAAKTVLPHFINLDEDPFKSKRFLYVLKKAVTVFGPKGDLQPLSLSVVRKHCEVTMELAGDGVSAVPGASHSCLCAGNVLVSGARLH